MSTCWRVNVVRNSGAIEGVSAAGFHDASLWEETQRKGDAAVKRLIDSGLDGTTVTVVLIGAETASRKFVSYEVEQSIARGNGILGIRINNIKDKDGRPRSTCGRSSSPEFHRRDGLYLGIRKTRSVGRNRIQKSQS